jgi:UDP-glucose 4-epimerase
VPLALDAILGRRPPLTVFGNDYPTPDGTAIRDYVHVSDLAEAHVRALNLLIEGGESGKVNLGTGHGYSVQEVLAMAHEITGRSVPHTTAPRRPGDPAELVANADNARALLGEDVVQRSSLASIVETAWAWHQRAPLPMPAA